MVRIASDDGLARSHTDSRAVAHLRTLWRGSVDFLEHREINVRSEHIFNRVEVGAMTVARELHTMRQAVFQIGEKMICAARVTLADEPAGHELCVGINR